MEPLRVDDYAELAESNVPAQSWGYVQGGSGVEWTIAENRAAFDRVVHPAALFWWTWNSAIPARRYWTFR